MCVQMGKTCSRQAVTRLVTGGSSALSEPRPDRLQDERNELVVTER
jgi:hypothetical protein